MLGEGRIVLLSHRHSHSLTHPFRFVFWFLSLSLQIVEILDIMKPESFAKYDDVYIVNELMNTDLHQIITSSQPLTDERQTTTAHKTRSATNNSKRDKGQQKYNPERITTLYIHTHLTAPSPLALCFFSLFFFSSDVQYFIYQILRGLKYIHSAHGMWHATHTRRMRTDSVEPTCRQPPTHQDYLSSLFSLSVAS